MLNEKQKKAMNRQEKAVFNLQLVTLALEKPQPSNIFKYMTAYTRFNRTDKIKMRNADKLAKIILRHPDRPTAPEWLQTLRIVLLGCLDDNFEMLNIIGYTPIKYFGYTYYRRAGTTFIFSPPTDNEKQTEGKTEGENIK